MHERSLHVHAQQHAEPDQIDADMLGRWPKERNHDEGNLEKIEEECEQENEYVDEDEKSNLPSWQRDQKLLNPFVAVDPVEGQREHARADQDEHDEGRELGGGLGGLARQVPAQASLDERKYQRAACSHGAALGRCGNPDENCPEHEKDQRK